jgi:hypothetical protein
MAANAAGKGNNGRGNSDSLRELQVKELELAESRRRWLAIATSVLSACAAFALTTTSFWRISFGQPRGDAERSQERLAAIEHRIDAIQVDIAATDKALSEIARPDDTTATGAQIAAVRSHVNDISQRLQIIERGLLESPEKSLSLPLLRADIGRLEESISAHARATADDIDRVYGQNQWFLGLMGTMAIAVFGMALTNLIQIRKPTITSPEPVEKG